MWEINNCCIACGKIIPEGMYVCRICMSTEDKHSKKSNMVTTELTESGNSKCKCCGKTIHSGLKYCRSCYEDVEQMQYLTEWRGKHKNKTSLLDRLRKLIFGGKNNELSEQK